MGFNPEKAYLKIKKDLINDGHKSEIHKNVFGVYTMKVIGTPSKVKAGKWMDTFELFGYIDIKNNIINFKV